MRVLVVGAGVIGTVYRAELAAGGHSVSVLAHGQRTEAIEREGPCAVDVLSGARCSARVAVLDDPERERFEPAQVAVRRDNLSAVGRVLRVR